MNEVNKKILQVMRVLENRAALNPINAAFFVSQDLLADCPDYSPIMEKLAQDFEAIAITQRPDEQQLDFDQLAVIEDDLTEYYSYEITLTSLFEPLLTKLNNSNHQGSTDHAAAAPDSAHRKVSFDTMSSILSDTISTCNIPQGTLEYWLCKLVFRNKKTPAKEQDIIEAFGGSYESQRAVYDAVGRINKRAEAALGIKKLLIFKMATVRIDKNYL